ncbi:MAG: hypothetical protein KKD31_00910 [Bacteroidetes bacterium]|nr:hypothetical protein [Bacteroidota bacterium]
MNIHIRKGFLFAIAAALFICSMLIRFIALSRTEFANGWDGYFYLVQLQSLFQRGSMHSPDFSTIYPIMIVIQWMSGNYELTYKICSAILAGAFTVSMFGVAFRWSRAFWPSLFIGAYTLFSPELTWFAAQYPKNLLGIIFFLLLLGTLKNRKPAPTLILLLLNFFGHRITFVLSGITVLLQFLGRRVKMKFLLITSAALLLIVVAGYLMPGLLNFTDLSRFSNEFSGMPQFAPVSFVNLFGSELVSGCWKFEIILLSVLFVVSAGIQIWFVVQKRANLVLSVFLIVLAVLIFPFFRFTAEGFGFRLFHTFVLLTPLPIVLFEKAINKAFIAVPLMVVAIIGGLFASSSYQPELHDPPYAMYAQVGKTLEKSKHFADAELLIGHKALAEYLTFSTGKDVMPWIPEYAVAREGLWRIATDIRMQELRFYLDVTDLQFVEMLSMRYTLIREDIWQKLLQQIVTKDNDEDLLEELNTWKNPNNIRPKYLSKDRKATQG